MKELPGFDLPTRPGIRSASSTGFEGPMSSSYNGARSESPANMPRLTRVPTEPSTLLGARSNLRITKSRDNSRPPDEGVFADDQSDYEQMQRTTSYGQESMAKKAPPPPPPSRASKPKPPPPPMKRSALSTSEVPSYYQG